MLRRDNFTCRYCGGEAPDVKLQVDHVLPTTLGGSDEPENLVTACADCNRGKASVAPDSPIVEDVAHDALRWRKAMEQAATIQAAHMERRDEYVDTFEERWLGWGIDEDNGGRSPVPRPDDWRQSIARFFDLGLDHDQLIEALLTAMQRDCIGAGEKFRYMCGVCWNILEERQSIASDLLADG